jgi:guanylate kinase
MRSASACLVVAGCSGVGKSTLISGVLAQNPHWMFAVSATTRPRRGNEVDGREYYFVERQVFEQRALAGDFLEYAEVYGQLYGTPQAEFERAADQDKHLLIEVDTVGCLSIRALRPEIPIVAVLPPSIAELKRRLVARETEGEASLAWRSASMVAELQRMRGFDYVVVNDDLVLARQQLLQIMAIAEQGLHLVSTQVDGLLAQAGGAV